jgi:hypothetical protein
MSSLDLPGYADTRLAWCAWRWCLCLLAHGLPIPLAPASLSPALRVYARARTALLFFFAPALGFTAVLSPLILGPIRAFYLCT